MQRLPRVNMQSQPGAQWNMGACAGGPWVLANRQEPRGRKVWINHSPWIAVVPLLTTRW